MREGGELGSLYLQLPSTATLLAEGQSQYHTASGIDWETGDVWLPLYTRINKINIHVNNII